MSVMLGFPASPRFDDVALGVLTRARGYWRGKARVGAETAPLAIVGSRREPDAGALDEARIISTAFAAWRPVIAGALFEHFAPYGQAIADGAARPTDLHTEIRSAADVWTAVAMHSVAVLPIDGRITTELVYAVRWDDDHLLGIRFQSGAFAGLCGSVLPA